MECSVFTEKGVSVCLGGGPNLALAHGCAGGENVTGDNVTVQNVTLESVTVAAMRECGLNFCSTGSPG